MACKYVKDFDFTPYKAGGHVKAQPKQDGYVAKKAEGGMCKAKGGVIEKATGEKYPSREAMVKHERKETPRMQKEEIVKSSVVKGAIPQRPAAVARKAVPVAPQSPLLAMQGQALKKGGKISEAKVGKVMTEFKEGKLHSGSKKGPEVESKKQALAIALSEGRKAAKKK
jgi:hypothetical protein